MTKQELMNAISAAISIRQFSVSTGSTEPREFLVAIAVQLGLGELVLRQGKVELARLILEALGEEWRDSYYSEGATVTKHYFEKLLEVIESTFKG